MWGAIVAVGGLIWDVFQGAVAATVAVLWSLVTGLIAGLVALGTTLWRVIGQVWGFLRPAWDGVLKPLIEDVGKAVWGTLKSLYQDVLKPAWQKFNSLVDRLHTWLQAKFAPILKWLTAARKYIENVYDQYVRPILDIIDVARLSLNILAELGVQWARQLEADLAALEQRIEAPFQFILSKLNEAINWINRIVDLDGLFQRIVLLRSLVRDVEAQIRILTNSRLRDLTAQERTTIHDNQHGKKRDAAVADVTVYIEGGGGPSAPMLDEMATIWEQYLDSAAI